MHSSIPMRKKTMCVY